MMLCVGLCSEGQTWAVAVGKQACLSFMAELVTSEIPQGSVSELGALPRSPLLLSGADSLLGHRGPTQYLRTCLGLPHCQHFLRAGSFPCAFLSILVWECLESQLDTQLECGKAVAFTIRERQPESAAAQVPGWPGHCWQVWQALSHHPVKASAGELLCFSG